MDSIFSMNQKSSIPLYLQLKERLIERILSGFFKPDEKLPSERELSEELSISRMTVRESLKTLVNEGYAYTRVGKGTYVNPVQYKQDTELNSFTEKMHNAGMHVSSKVLDFTLEPAAPFIADKLGVKNDELIYKLKRIRYANQKVMAIETAYLPSSLCEDLQKFDFSIDSLYTILRKEYGLHMVLAEQSVIASLANDEENKIFETKSPAAVLRMKRITMSTQKRVIEYVDSVYRGDSYILHTKLTG